MRRRILVQADAYIAGKKVAFITFVWICRTRTAASSRPIRRNGGKLFAMVIGGVRLFRRSAAIDLVRQHPLAVAKIVKGGERLRSQMFAELQSHYLFATLWQTGQGNDKGRSRLVGYVRRNFMTPFPVADSFDALNARFLDACMKRRQAILRGSGDDNRCAHCRRTHPRSWPVAAGAL